MKNQLSTKNLLLSPPCLEDFPAIVAFEERNRDHLSKWEATNPGRGSSLMEEVKNRLENWIKECAEGKSVRFVMRLKSEPQQIIGFCNFTQIFYGSFQACYLGYKIDYAYEGKGLMFEALTACIGYVFEKMGIHRIMANYMPINYRSANLLQRLGFTRERYAKNYLMINGKWEDHVLNALSIEEWQAIRSK